MRQYKPFQFKQFSIDQNNAAMKVGTDCILLGAWALINTGDRILDIGTGTGILPLMLAQKVIGNCYIDAIEIEENAIKDAQLNFKSSPWSNSLHLIHQDFNQYETTSLYDVIISNPPFFEGLAPTNKSRSAARNASDKLSYENLIEKASKLLTQNGRLYLIIPQENYDKVISISTANGLQLRSQINLRPKIGKPIHRVLLQLKNNQTINSSDIKLQESELIIRNEKNEYTAEHISFTKEYYLGLK